MKYVTKAELFQNLESYSKAMSNYSVGKIVKSGFGINLVVKHLKNKNASILDIGTAGGEFVKQLSRQGYRDIYSVDIHDFRSVKEGEFRAVDLNYENLPWEDESCDAIIGWCILPHLENPHNFIREARRVLKKEGLLFLTQPNIFSLFSRWRFFRYGDFPRYKRLKDHISIFTKAIFETTVLKYFDLVEEDYYIRRDKKFFKQLYHP